MLSNFISLLIILQVIEDLAAVAAVAAVVIEFGEIDQFPLMVSFEKKYLKNYQNIIKYFSFELLVYFKKHHKTMISLS